MVDKIPEQLKDLKFCRVRHKTKKPFEKGWTKKPYNYEEISKFKNENYGVLCGYNSLAVIDCDREELALAVKTILPKTFSVKTGGGGTHFYYLIPELKKKIILDAGKEHLGEVQSHGTQVIGSGSLHPNNKTYEIIDDVEIKEISLKELYSVIENFVSDEVETDKRKETGELTKLISSEMNFKRLLDGYGLKKKEENYNCPFHKSEGGQCLSVDENKGIFNCFHCGRKGNIISFVSDLEGITIKEAIQKIKKLTNKEEKEVGDFLIYNKKGDPKNVSIDKVVDHLLEKYKFKTIFHTKSETIYFYKNGLWAKDGRAKIKTEVEKLLGVWSKNNIVNEILEKIKRKTEISEEEFNKNPEGTICIENGLLDLKTLKLSDFSSDYYFKSRIPLFYDPKAKCPEIKKFFSDTLYSEDISLIKEWFGFNLYNRYFEKKAIIFFGERDTGKTVMVGLLSKYIGEKNKVGLSLQKITYNKSFDLLCLKDKYSNIHDDLSSKDLSDVGGFKIATGGGYITGEEKFGDHIDFLTFAKHTFATNKIPPTKDIDDDAYFGRWMPIAFDNIINEKDQDKFLIQKITTKEELSGLLNLALEGLKRLFENNKFSFNKSIEEVKNIMQRSSHPLVAFAQDCLEEKDGNIITKEEMFVVYTAWCNEKKFARMTKEQLGRQFERFVPYVWAGHDGKYRVWLNVAFNIFSKELKKSVKNNEKLSVNNTLTLF